MPRIHRRTAFVASRSVLVAALIAWFGGLSGAQAQLRDSFESPQSVWQLSPDADCGVKLLAQQRTFRDAHSGNGSEFVRLSMGNGSRVYLTYAIGQAPLIEEFAPSLWVKANKADVQLLLRVVLPRAIDEGTGRPITTMLQGAKYTEVGSWQELKVAAPAKLLDRDFALQKRFGKSVDTRGAYADLVVVNAYASPGVIDLWLDDLEIPGYVNLADEKQTALRATTPDRPAANATSKAASDPRRGVALQGSLLMVNSRPMMPRAIEHNGEPLEWLQSLGFNAVKLSVSPSARQLKEAERLGLWLIAPPPFADGDRLSSAYDRVLAWSLGDHLAGQDLAATNSLAAEIRRLDPQVQRPLLAGPTSDLLDFSRVANILQCDQPILGTSFEMSAYGPWIADRPRLTRPGTSIWAGVSTHVPAALREQLILMGRGANYGEDFDLEQTRLAAYCALSAGVRGLVFRSAAPLNTSSNAGAQRVNMLKLLNYELVLLEPWAAAGTLSENVESGDPGIRASVLQTERSKLLLVTRHAPAQQYVAGPPDARPVVCVIPGVPISDRAYQVKLGGLKQLRGTHTSGGLRITLEEPGLADAVVITQDPLVVHHFNRVLGDGKLEIARLRYELLARQMTTVAEVDRELTVGGHPLAAAQKLLYEGVAHQERARRALETNDVDNLHVAAARCEKTLAKIRRGHWEQTAGDFPSPAASPCITQFSALPNHWKFAERIKRVPWGANSLAAGDMESLEQLVRSGWKNQQQSPPGVVTDVSLSGEAPHGGRSALRMRATPDGKQPPPVLLERPPVWITSAPTPVRQGQLLRIHGWVQVPARLIGGYEGLLIYDSLTGPDLGDRIQLTQGWREFTLYRAVPKNGELTVTFAMSGLGEALLDDVSVAIIRPEPIRETAPALGRLPVEKGDAR